MTQAEERHGHHWRDPDMVAGYVERMDRRAAEREETFALMARLATDDASAPLRVLDIGSGYAPVAAAILDVLPNATAVGLDISDAMMDVGRERMARFGDRFAYQVGDFADGVMPPEAVALGPFDLVVSSRAIHHLPAELMATLYASIFEHLKPGGAFFNFDTTSAETPELHEKYRTIRRAESQAPQRAPGEVSHSAQFPHHRDATLAKHLEWLEAAGFTSVDCYWKRLDQGLLGGFKPA